MAGADAGIDVEYRAIGNLAGPLEDAKRGISKLGESYDQLKRKAEAAEAEARRSASATGQRAVRMGNETAARNYITRGMSEAGGRTSGREMMARGMHEMGREYRVHQEVERMAQADAALQSRKRSILAANTIAGGGVDLQRADRVDPTTMSMRQHYRAIEGRQRQARLDAMQTQQMADARQRSGVASAASQEESEFRARMAARRERRALPWNAGAAEERLARIRGGRPQGMLSRLAGPGGDFGASRTMQYAANIYGIGGITAGIYQWLQSNREMIKKSDDTAEAYDTLARSLRIQANFDDRQTAAAQGRIGSIAYKSAADKDFAYGAATQLVSSGFSGAEATGGSLTELLKGVNAMPAPGGGKQDPVRLAESVAAYMNSQGMEKTSVEVRSIMSAVQALYKSTNLQLNDFSEFAREAPALKGKMGIQEQLSAFSILRDVGNTAEEAATVLRNIALRGETTASSPEKVEALATVGMTPEDIDMNGESFTDVLGRFAEAFKGKDSPEVTNVLKKVFEERAAPGIKQLIEDRGKLAERTKIASDAGAYEEDATTMSSGPAAAKRRQQLRAESFLKTHAQYDEELREELAQNALERGESAFRVDARRKQFDLYRGGGMSRDLSAAAAFGGDDMVGILKTFGLGTLSNIATGDTSGVDRLAEAKAGLKDKGLELPPEEKTGDVAVPESESRADKRLRLKRKIAAAQAILGDPNVSDWEEKYRGAKLDKAIAEGSLRRMGPEDEDAPRRPTPKLTPEELLANAGRRPVGESNKARDERLRDEARTPEEIAENASRRPVGESNAARDARMLKALDSINDRMGLLVDGKGAPVILRPPERRAPGSGAAALANNN